jgi:hypothetical protein
VSSRSAWVYKQDPVSKEKRKCRYVAMIDMHVSNSPSVADFDNL